MSRGLQNPASSAPYLLKLISEEKLSPRQLTTHQRRICVRYLLQQGNYLQFEIANILQVPEAYVSRDKKKIQEQNTWMVDEIDERRIAVDLITTAERACARLTKANKHRDAWTVARELVDVLQTLGYIKRKPIEFQGKLTLEEMLTLAGGGQGEESIPREPGSGASSVLTNGAH